jgi:IMP dehydrogenase
MYNNQTSYSFDDVLIVPKYSTIKSRNECILTPTFEVGDHITKKPKLSIPVISANMDTITGIEMAKYMHSVGGIGILHRNVPVSEVLMLRETMPVFAAVGSLETDRERITSYLENDISVCVDIAHGHSLNMERTLKFISDYDTGNIVIAGNVCTPEGAEDLFNWGADIIKVGVGGGSACTTRMKTGCGYPQLHALSKVSTLGIPFIADGGIKNAGDAAKALATGASFVMIGGMLAGTDKVPDWDENATFMDFRGMASMSAKKDTGLPLSFEEGVSVKVKTRPKGSTDAVIKEICDGIRSAMSYCGSKTLKQFDQNAEFVYITASTQKENNAHIQLR